MIYDIGNLQSNYCQSGTLHYKNDIDKYSNLDNKHTPILIKSIGDRWYETYSTISSRGIVTYINPLEYYCYYYKINFNNGHILDKSDGEIRFYDVYHNDIQFNNIIEDYLSFGGIGKCFKAKNGHSYYISKGFIYSLDLGKILLCTCVNNNRLGDFRNNYLYSRKNSEAYTVFINKDFVQDPTHIDLYMSLHYNFLKSVKDFNIAIEEVNTRFFNENIFKKEEKKELQFSSIEDINNYLQSIPSLMKFDLSISSDIKSYIHEYILEETLEIIDDLEEEKIDEYDDIPF